MAVLIDSYSETNQDSSYGMAASGGVNRAIGESFNAGAGYTLSQAKFYLKRTGSPTGNAFAKLYAVTGTPGTNAKPTGAALATSDAFDVSTLTTSYQLITFTFSTPYALAAGTDYIITFEYSSGGDGSNFVNGGVDNSSPGHSGNGSVKSAADAWSSVAQDVCFYVYGDSPVSTAGSVNSIPSFAYNLKDSVIGY